MTDIQKVRLLSRKEASSYLQETWGIIRSPKTIAKYASLGGGPPFRKDTHRCLYEPADLDDWAQSLLTPKLKSTSDQPRTERFY